MTISRQNAVPAPYSKEDSFDWIGPLCMLLLAITGVFFIYSSHVQTGAGYWKRQLFWIVAGGGVYLAVAHIHYRRFLEYAHILFYLSLLALLVVRTPLGTARGGAQRWIDFQLFLFQPSETAKIGVLLMVASILARTRVGSVRGSLITLLFVSAVTLLPLFLIFLQPDLGSALTIPPLVLALLFTSHLSARFFVATFTIIALFLAVIAVDIYRYYDYFTENNLSFTENRGAYEEHSWVPLRDYQRNRILANIAPDAIDPRGIAETWNLRQSLISVGSGGAVGKGWTEGTQARLGYLPSSVAHNDFIFSVIAEEKGFMGSLFVIGLYAGLIANGIRIAGATRDRFASLLAVGVSVIFLVHVFINIGMTFGLMPITGLPLPFLSYGGSFFLTCCVLQGLVQSVYRHRRDFS